MRLYQHVYGRVNSGVKGDLPGYQLAAISDGIADDVDLVNFLNRLSFFHRSGRAPDEVRHSFFRFKDAYVVFGASRLARDKGGSIGSFAHNLVLKREEFLDCPCSPVDVLTSYHFLASEHELSERKLPEIQFEPERFGVTEDGKAMALSLIDMILGKPSPTIPMVILQEREMWTLLALVFRMLPKQEASRLSFSSVFVDALDYVNSFQLVFVPEKGSVPIGTQIFRIINPSVNIPSSHPASLRSLWEHHADQGENMLRLVNILRHHPEREKEILPLIPSLISLGPVFRSSVEDLKVQGISDVLFRNVDWTVRYWRLGSKPTPSVIAEMMWRDPDSYGKPLLAALAQEGDEEIIAKVIKEVTAKLLQNAAPLSILDFLLSSGAAERFYRLLPIDNVTIPRVCEITAHIQARDPVNLRLHEKIAAYCIELIQSFDRRRLEELIPWLSEQASHTAPHSFFQATAECAAWILNQRKLSWHAGNYHLSPAQYLRLLGALWSLLGQGRVDISGSAWVQTVFHPDFDDVFLGSLTDNLGGFGARFQRDVIEAVAKRVDPSRVFDRFMSPSIGRSERPARLAQFYMDVLMSIGVKNRGIIDRLEGVVGKTRGFFF